MKIIEIGTGYTSIPANKGAATEIVVDCLSCSLIKLGHDVTVVDIEDQNRLPTKLPIVEVKMPHGFSATDEALGIKHKLKRVIYSVALAKTLKRMLATLPADEHVVLHFHNQYNAFFFYKLIPAKLREKAMVAYTCHSYIWHNDWDKIEGVVKKRYFQEVDAMRRADVVFTLNEDAREKIVNRVGVPADRVVLIDNGVDVDVYRPLSAGETDRLRAPMGLAGARALIQVGSVCDRKNQLGALQMLEPLMQQMGDLVYLYAGGIIDDEYKASIDEYAASHGIADRVRYLGELKPGKDLNDYYNVATCSVFTTKAEAFGLVVIESMASGCPVLIDAALQTDLIGPLKYSNPDEFRVQVERLLTDEGYAAAQSASSRTKAASQYSWDKVAGDYLRGFSGARWLVEGGRC